MAFEKFESFLCVLKFKYPIKWKKNGLNFFSFFFKFEGFFYTIKPYLNLKYYMKFHFSREIVLNFEVE